jgi:hypothetical protein
MATGEARMPDAAFLPPRSALPRDVDIPVLPGVGITWYDRDGRCWARRVALALMWAVALLLIVLIDVRARIRHAGRLAMTRRTLARCPPTGQAAWRVRHGAV